MTDQRGSSLPPGPAPHEPAWPPRLARVSLPLFVALALAFSWYGRGPAHESLLLLTILNTLFGAAISLLIAHLAGQSYSRTGALSHLYLGAGSLTFAIAYLLPGPLMTWAADHAVAVHNTGVLLAGACFLSSARRAMNEGGEGRAAKPALVPLALAVALPVAAMGLVLWGSVTHVIPEFFVEGRGMTPLRQAVLGTAVAEFLLASLWFGALHRRTPAPFLSWYSLGLAMIGLGLGAVIPAGPPGSLLGWAGRFGQYLGCLYLLFATLSMDRDAGGWRIPLEQALRKREEEFSSLFDLFAVGMAHADPETGRLTRVNEKLCGITGYSREELLRLTTADLTLPEDRDSDRAAIESALRRETPGWSSLKRYRRKDGGIVWVQVTGTVLFDEHGRPWQGTAIVEDVTARVAADAERERLLADVQRSAGELDAVFQELPFLVSVVGPQGNHERVNPAMVRLFGFDPAATPRADVARRLDARFPDGTPLTPENMPSSRALRGERADDVEYLVTDAQGERRTLLVSAVPLRSGGTIYGALLVQRDVTGERRAAEKIRHLASFPELNPNPVVELDRTGAVTFRNAAAREALLALGLEDDARRFLPGELKDHLAAAERGEATPELGGEVVIGGRIFGARVQVLPALGAVRIYALDLTALKAAEAERARLYERLELAHAELERKVQERTADLNRTVQRLRVTSELLQLFQRVVTRQQYLDAVVGVLQAWSGCACVGIRIDEGAGPVGFAAQRGFDGAEPSLAGFASIAAVPVTYRGRIRGLIHLADRRPGAVPPATVEFLESLVPLIGEAVHRYDTEAELERHRAHLEELVELRTVALQRTAAELERSNRDLDQFASAVSHDLKEPLRAVAGYATLLQRKYGGQFDGKADAYLAGAVDGAERMQQLIDDLLSYARVGSRGGELRPADAEAAFTAAVANVRVGIEEAGAALTHDPLPTLRSDPAQLVQLFQNLIANAVKFRGAEPPRIHVGAAREPGQWRLWVRDNGIGIDPRFQERIFEIFQRLHPRSAYPGTGIGLAVCKRIVERHGGRIWVESEPGRGATFFFTIPDAGGEAP